jgi:hypothetical protein
MRSKRIKNKSRRVRKTTNKRSKRSVKKTINKRSKRSSVRKTSKRSKRSARFGKVAPIAKRITLQKIGNIIPSEDDFELMAEHLWKSVLKTYKKQDQVISEGDKVTHIANINGSEKVIRFKVVEIELYINPTDERPERPITNVIIPKRVPDDLDNAGEPINPFPATDYDHLNVIYLLFW